MGSVLRRTAQIEVMTYRQRRLLRAVDNRDSRDMQNWQEARIEALQRRIVELECENSELKKRLEGAYGR